MSIQDMEKIIADRKADPKNAQYHKVLSMLTPETVKRELLIALHKLESVSDPRMFNNPLPNDAVPTKRFGALSYLFDGYPGFTWRLGSWYKIDYRLHFSSRPKDELRMLLFKPIDKGSKFNAHEPDATMHLDEAFYPVKIDGSRVFLREIWGKKSYSFYENSIARTADQHYMIETIMYSPELQACIECNNNIAALQKYHRVVFEDPENMVSYQR